MANYNIHKDFSRYQNLKIPINPISLPFMSWFSRVGFKYTKLDPNIHQTQYTIKGYQNANIKLTVFEPNTIADNAPCLIFLHGGGFCMAAAPHHKHLICEYALQTPCKVVFVDYRLAPKHAFPVGVEDCYAAYLWVLNHAKQLKIDTNKIAISGDSAGGNLATAVCLMARDRNTLNICFQMLIYPVTDATQTSESIKRYVDTPVWNSKLNQKMWEVYLKNTPDILNAYASPMQAASLKGLPDAYIEVAEFDCLHDEGIAYANALKQNQIDVELYETKQTIHGFEIATDSEIVKTSVKRRVTALKRAFMIEGEC